MYLYILKIHTEILMDKMMCIRLLQNNLRLMVAGVHMS